MGPILIALVGPLGAGKDTVAKYLVEKRGFRRLAFADEIKRGYYAISGHTEEEFKAARGTVLEAEIREGLWRYSDCIKEEKGDDYFINFLIGCYGVCCNPCVVVTDIRTIQELNALRNIGAKIILVFRDKVSLEQSQDKIPGTRLSLSDFLPEDKIFFNIEYSNPELVEKSIEKFFQEANL